jgi:DNA-binding LacI/PurR family transcriptional regulator/DNA-binding transcriptional regulator YhcF (GntR family)
MDWKGFKLEHFKGQSAPLYVQIADNIRHLIENHTLKVGERIPTSRELQKILNLSSITIENGLKQLVKEKILLRHPRRGTFVADPEARTAPLPNLKICVTFCNIKSAPFYWHQILGFLEEQFRAEGFGLIFQQANSANFDINSYDLDFCGLILCGNNSYDMAKAFEAQGVPVVLIGSLDKDVRLVDGELDMVVHNDEERAAVSTRHLLDMGHRDIVCVTGPAGSQYSAKQKAGYRKTMKQYGVNADDKSFIEVKEIIFDLGIQAGYRIFCSDLQPSAIYCGSDMVAAGIVRVAEKLGIKIPEDVSIIGCGGLDIALNSRPRITTTVSKPEESARLAGAKLLERINGGRTEKETSIVRVTEIDFGDSTMVFKNNNVAVNH